jgi:hypothetical protein
MSKTEAAVKMWERQSGESSEAFQAFEEYLQIGADRSLSKVAQALSKSKQLLARWSKRDRWQERVLAFDRWQGRALNESLLSRKAEMRARQASTAEEIQRRVLQRIQNMTPAEIDSMPISQVVALFKAGTEVERKSRDIGRDELDAAQRDDTPTFVIEFVPGRPEGMVSVRMADGVTGYIPAENVEWFLSDHPGAIAIR